MFTPQTYTAALLLMMLSMACWGSWANAQKIDSRWRFELFYLDYSAGLLAAAVLFGLTLGRTHPASPDSFFLSLRAASARAIWEALAAGAIFSVGNLLLVAAISVAGMAVAFPVGAGLALVIGAVLNFILSPVGNPVLIFGGIALVCVAIVLDALAYRGLQAGGASSAKGAAAKNIPSKPKTAKTGAVSRKSAPGKRRSAKAGPGGSTSTSTSKGILLSVLGGVGAGLFYPLVAKSLAGPGHLVPYTVYFVFAVGAMVSAIPLAYILMRRPVAGARLGFKDYRAGAFNVHAWGAAGGLVWGVGTIANFVASYVPIIGPATAFSMGEGNTMISAVWGVFVWKEFKGANGRVKVLLGLMFLFFLLGLTSIALAPVVK